MKGAGPSTKGQSGSWVLSLGIGLVAVGVSSAASNSHGKNAATNEHHTRHQKDAEQDGQREQDEVAHGEREQSNPAFELFQRQRDQRSHDDDRNSNGDGEAGIHFDELPQLS